MPSDVREIFERSDKVSCLLKIYSPVGLQINTTQFYDPDYSECDFDPREFVTQHHVDEMCDFISLIGRTLGAAVSQLRTKAILRLKEHLSSATCEPAEM